MKHLKNLGLILIIFVVVFSNIGIVEARGTASLGGYTAVGFGEGERYTGGATEKKKSASQFSVRGMGVTLKAGTRTYGVGGGDISYYEHKIDGKAAYCLDARLPSTADVYAARFAYYTQYELERITPGGDKQQRVYAQDIAFAYALKNGGHYFKTSIAIRTLSVIFGTDTYGNASNVLGAKVYQDQYEGFRGTVKKWVSEDPELGTLIENIRSKVVELSKVEWQDPNNYKSANSNYYWKGDLVDQARDLFKESLQEVWNFYKDVTSEDGDVEVKLDSSGKPSASTAVETEDANGTLISQEKEHEIVITGLDKLKDPSFKFTDFIVDYADAQIEVTSITVDGGAKCSSGDECKGLIDRKDNILAGLTLTDKTVIKIKVKVSGYKYVKEGSGKTKLDCDKLPVNYHISYEAKISNDGSGEGGAGSKYSGDNRFFIVWYNIKDNTKGACSSVEPSTNVECKGTGAITMQRFITDHGTADGSKPGEEPGVGDEGKTEKGTIDDSMPLLEKCDECDDLREKCQAEDSAACSDYLKNCDKCETYPVMCSMGIAVYCDEMKKDEYKKECPVEETCTALQAACITSGSKTGPECTKYDDFVKTEYPEGCGDCTTWDQLCKDPFNDSDACDKYKDPANSCEKCEEWETLCLAGDDDACQKFNDAKCPEDDCGKLQELCNKLPGSDYCKKYEETCDRSKIECGTELTELMECCDGEEMVADDMFKWEGMMKDPFKISGVIEDNIKMCFVKNVADRKDPEDEAKNPYALTPESGTLKSGKSDFEDNPFCKVNCREDYGFLFPTAKRVNAGRYFTFQVKLQEANKQCFTSKIDKEAYIEKINGILQRIEKSFNDYQRYKKAEEVAHTKDKGSYKTGCGGDETTGCTETTSVIEIGATTGSYNAPQVKFNINTSRGELNSIINTSASFGPEEGDTPELNCAGYSEKVIKTRPDGSTYETTEHVDCGTYYDAGNQFTEEKLKDMMKKEKEFAEDAYNAATKELEDTIKLYEDCTSWQTKYDLKPNVQYNYDAGRSPDGYYASKLEGASLGMPLQMDGSGSISTKDEEQYCIADWNNMSADVDETYKTGSGCNFGGNETQKLKYSDCDLTSGTCDTKEVEVSKAVFKKQLFELDGEVTYRPKTIFYNIYPTGEIEVGTNGENSTGINGEKNSLALEGDIEGENVGALAVPLNATRGVYKYDILVTDLGEFYDTGEKGRFSGAGSKSVLTVKTGKDNLDFVCAYLVNIPEATMKCDFNQCTGDNCKSQCLGSGCDDFECDDIKCVTQCIGVGCIYDTNTGSSLMQKTVTLNKLFPNGTEAYNWDVATNTKAKDTISEIEEKANTIYDTNPVLSITIGPSQANEIRKYNERAVSDGSYSNKTMYCKDSSSGGYELIHCYSKFLDDNIFSGSGVMGTVNSKSTALSDRPNVSSYFETWSGYDRIKDVAEQYMVGPAWK